MAVNWDSFEPIEAGKTVNWGDFEPIAEAPRQAIPNAPNPTIPLPSLGAMLGLGEDYQAPPSAIEALQANTLQPRIETVSAHDWNTGETHEEVLPGSWNAAVAQRDRIEAEIAYQNEQEALRQAEAAANPPTLGDHLRTFGAAEWEGVGAAARGVGGLWRGAYNELVGKPLSTITGTNQVAYSSPLDGLADVFSGVGENIRDNTSEGYKQLRRDNRITGDIFTPSSISLGENPSIEGVIANGVDVLGSLAPIVAASMLSGGSAATGLAVGGAQGGGAAMEQAGGAIDKMYADGTLANESQVYRDLLAQGVSGEAAYAETRRRAEEWALGPATAIAGIGGAITSKLAAPGSQLLSKFSMPVRVGGTAGLSSLEESLQEVGEGVGTQFGINVGAGTDLDLMEGSGANAILGALGGAGPGLVGGLTSDGYEAGANDSKPPRRNAQAWMGDLAAALRAEQPGAIDPEILRRGREALADRGLAVAPAPESDLGTVAPEPQDDLNAALLRALGDPAVAAEPGITPESAPAATTPAPSPAERASPPGQTQDFAARVAARMRMDAQQRTAGMPAQSPAAPNGSRPAGGDLAPVKPQAQPSMQNRDRSRPASVAQMQDIRRNPDPVRLGFSRDSNTGAPMVARGQDLAEADLGRTDTVVMPDGRRVQVQYAVVEAGAVQASHNADGQINPAYDGAPLQALNNGRAAGVQAAWQSGNAEPYREGLAADAGLHGVSAEAIADKRQPMLVRLYDPTENLTGAQSNASQQLGLSPVEQAKTDAESLPDLSGLTWNEDGSIPVNGNAEFFRAWFRNMGDTAAATLQDAQGRPNAAALQRLRAAMIGRAYGDERLLSAVAEDVNPDNRNILNALAQAATSFATLEQDESLADDVKSALVGGLELVREAANQGQSLEKLLEQGDLMGRDPSAVAIARFMAANTRSAKRMAEAFRAIAEYTDQAQRQAANLDVFGGPPPATIGEALNAAGIEADAGSVAEDAAGRYRGGEQAGRGRAAAGDAVGEPDPRQPAAGLFGAPTWRERVDAAARQKDTERDGRDRDVPGVGALPLFAGRAPEQADVETGQLPEQDVSTYGNTRPLSTGQKRDGVASPAADASGRAARGELPQLDLFVATRGSKPPGQGHEPVVKVDRLSLLQSARLVETGQFRSGIERVTSLADAAHILAPLRKSAQERFMVLALGADSKPLAVMQHTIRGVDGAQVHSGMILGAIASVPGVKSVVFAHNHPSGSTQPSAADIALDRRLLGLFQGSGIDVRGSIIVQPGQRTFTTYGENGVEFRDGPTDNIRTARRSGSVPKVERVIRKVQPVDGRTTIMSPEDGRQAATKARRNTPNAVILLNTRHEVIGTIPFDPESAEKLRTGNIETSHAKHIAAATEANAAAAIIYGDGSGEKGLQNMARAMKAADLRVLDIFKFPADNGLVTPRAVSLAGEGRDIGFGPLESTPLTEASRENGQDDADANGLRDAVSKALGPVADKVTYLRGLDGLPKRLREGVNRKLQARGGKGRTAALYDPKTGGVYLFTDVVTTPNDAVFHVAHELAGHHGLRKLLGDKLDAALEIALQNPTVEDVAKAIAKERGIDFTTQNGRMLAAEEALAELAAAVRTGNYDQIASRYNVPVPEGIRTRVKAAIDNFLKRLKALLGKQGVVFKDSQVRELLEAAWQAANGRGEALIGEPGGLESTKRAQSSFAEQVHERLQSGERRGPMLDMGRTPAVLRMLGLPELPLRMPAGVLFKLATGKGGERASLTERQIAHLPELLDEPVAVFRDKKRPDNLVVLTTAIDKDSKPIVVAIQPSAAERYAEVNIVTTAFGRDQAEAWLEREAGRLLYLGDKTNPRLSLSGLDQRQADEGNAEGSKQTILRTDDLRNFRAEQRRKAFDGLESVEEGDTLRPQRDDMLGERTPSDTARNAANNIARREAEAKKRRQAAADTLGVETGERGSWDFPKELWHTPQGAKGRFRTGGKQGVGVNRHVRAEYQDKMIAFRDVQRAIEKASGKELEALQNVYQMENLMHGRVMEGFKRYEEKRLEPLAKAMHKAGLDMSIGGKLATLAGGPELTELEAYLWARHAKERNAVIADKNPKMPDGGSGMSNATADKVLAAADTAKLEPLAKQVDRIARETRKRLLEHGIITKAQHDAMTSQYEHFVPLRGQTLEADQEFTNASVGAGGIGLDGRGKVVREAMGRGAGNPPTSILGEVIRDAQASIIQAEKARVGRTMMRLVLANPNPMWGVEPVNTERVVDANSEVYERAANDAADPAVVYVRQKGELYKVQLNAPLAKAFAHVGVEQMTQLTRVAGKINRYFSAIYTKYNPYFIARNGVRDMIFGMTGLIAEHGELTAFKAAMAYPGAARAAYRHARGKPPKGELGQRYAEYIDDGGKTGWVSSRSAEDLARGLGGGMTGYDPQGIKKAARVVGDFIGDANDAVESALRFAAYTTLRDKGVPRQQSAFYSKDLTVNFNRKGFSGSSINAWLIFFNPAMQGSKRFIDLAKAPKAMGYMMGLASIQALAMMAAMGGDDEEGEPIANLIPEHLWKRNLVVVVNPEEARRAIAANEIDGDNLAGVITIPMPYGVNVLTYSAGRIVRGFMDEEARPEDSAAGVTSDILSSAVQGIVPVPIGEGASGLIHPLIGIFADIHANKNYFGSAIHYKYADKTVPLAQQGRPDTLEIYKTAARALNRVGGGDEVSPAEFSWFNVAPEDVEYVVNELLGGPIRFVSDMATMTGQAFDPNVDLDPRDMPVLNSFYTNVDRESAQQSLYYNRNDAIERAAARVNLTFKSEGFESAQKLLQTTPELQGAVIKRLNATSGPEDAVRAAGETGGLSAARAELRKHPELAGVHARLRGGKVSLFGLSDAEDRGRNKGPANLSSAGNLQFTTRSEESVYALFKAAQKAVTERNSSVRAIYAEHPATVGSLLTGAGRKREAAIREADRERADAQEQFNDAYVRQVVGAAE